MLPKKLTTKKEDAFDPKVKREMWDQLALFHTLTRKKGRFKCSKARFLASIQHQIMDEGEGGRIKLALDVPKALNEAWNLT